METNIKKFMPLGRTKLIDGSILNPELAGLRLILVPCSENGKPDTALHLLLNKKWQKVGQELKGWFSHHIDFKLGSISAVATQSDIWIINALCYTKDDVLDEKALESCVKKLSELALSEKASVHVAMVSLESMPVLQGLVQTWLLDKGVHCYFYQEASATKTVVEAETVKEDVEPVAVKAAPKKVSKPAKAKPSPKKVVVAETSKLSDTDDKSE